MVSVSGIPERARRSRLWLAGGLVLAVVAALLSTVLTTAPASAHEVLLSAETSCQVDGTWTVSWHVDNSEAGANEFMLVRAVSVTDGTLVGIEANGTYDWIVDAAHPDASEGGGSIVAPDGAPGLTFTTPGLSASVPSVTLSLTGFWKYMAPFGLYAQTVTQQLSIDRPADCVDHRPGQIQIHKSTTGATAPSGPFVFDVTQSGQVVTTITVPANGTGTSGDLAPGVYSLVEENAPATSSITPNPVTVPANGVVVVDAVNTYPDSVDVGGIVVTAPATPVTVSPTFTG
jgi:Prealbumin-like fold domain